MARYGARHRAARAKWAPRIATGRVLCARCQQPIQPGQAWDMGHHDGANRDQHSGPEHADCNRRTRTHLAGRKARAPEKHPGNLRRNP